MRSRTLRRRELGALLRALRSECGLTVERVAERLLCSPSKVSRMETGLRGATARDVRDLCDLYGVADPDERARMVGLAAEGKQQGWWQSYELDYFATFVGLEQGAISARNFQSTTVPGLLQTADYARAMHDSGVPELTPKRIDELTHVRLTRQRLLTRDPSLRFWALLDESVLHRLVGGHRVMRDQLQRMVEVAKLPNLTIQVLPLTAGAHPAMESNFTILEFGAIAPSVVYVEGLVGCIYLERPQDQQRYEIVFERLRDMALDPQESVELIAEIAAKSNHPSRVAGTAQ